MNNKLIFGSGNAKLSKAIATFSLPAGHACPFAKECLSKSDQFTGRIIDGKHCRFRCFAASGEARATSVRVARWKNFNLMRDSKAEKRMAQVIQNSLPPGVNPVRVHVSGDFFNERYFIAWVNVALNNPMVPFYGYTKATPFLVKYGKYLPQNFRFTASKGGTHDHLIEEHDLRSAEVVFSPEEAEEKGLEIDHDDSHALGSDKSFALLLHGTQPPNTEAGRAWVSLMRRGIGGYGEGDYRKMKITKDVQIYITLKNGKVYIPMHKGKPVLASKRKQLVYA